MSVPTIKETNWLLVIPQLLFMGLVIGIYYLAGIHDFFVLGMLTYGVISFGVRGYLTREHRQGINRVNQSAFHEAIPYFQNSYDFFNKHPWIDKHRYITMLTPSKMCYREMALNNLAFCYVKTGNADKAIEFYERCVAEYPENAMARRGLNLLKAHSNKE